MKFVIENKTSEGEIVFQGTANKAEAEFLLNVGLNYLLAQGAMPMLTGKDDDDDEFSIADEPDQMQ